MVIKIYFNVIAVRLFTLPPYLGHIKKLQENSGFLFVWLKKKRGSFCSLEWIEVGIASPKPLVFRIDGYIIC